MLAYRESTSTRSRSGALGCIASKLCKCMQAQTSVLSSSSFALTRRTVYVGTYVYECAGCQRGGKPLISGNSDNLDAYAIIAKKTERRRQLTGASANHPCFCSFARSLFAFHFYRISRPRYFFHPFLSSNSIHRIVNIRVTRKRRALLILRWINLTVRYR